MARTRAELVERVLRRLGRYEVGQEVSPENYAMVDAEIPGILAQLRRDNVVSVSNVESIADEVFSPLSKIIAYDLADDFGISGESLVALAGGDAEARPLLRRMRALPADETRVISEYY